MAYKFLAPVILTISTLLSGGAYTSNAFSVLPVVYSPVMSDTPNHTQALNFGQAPFTISEETAPMSSGGPDLIILAITWSPENPQTEEKVTFTVSIKNLGSSQAPTSHVDFYIDGVSRGYQLVHNLDAGATFSNTFPWVSQPGSHEIKAIADALEQVVETDESNNEKLLNFSTLAPDLVIQSIAWSPEFPLEGDRVTLTATICNQGKGKSYSSSAGFYVDDTYLTSAFVSPLDTGASANVTSWWYATPGLHTFKATADVRQDNAESDEGNNSKTISLPSPDPDLVVKSILISPASPLAADPVTFTVIIRNQGNSQAGPSRLEFYIDLATYYGYVNEIDAGAEAKVTFPWTAVAGSHVIKAVLDSENFVIEVSETNNTKTGTFSVSKSPAPDLTIQSIVCSPEHPVVGDNATFTATVKNQGSKRAAPANLDCYVDDTLMTSARVGPLDAGASLKSSFTWAAQSGSHSIKIIIDKANEVIESDEANNEQKVDVPVSTSAATGITPPGQSVPVSFSGQQSGDNSTATARVVSLPMATGTGDAQKAKVPITPAPRKGLWTEWWLTGSIATGALFVGITLLMVKRRKS